MEAVEITREMIANAPARVSAKRGRQKGSSPVEKAFRAGFESGNEIVFGAKISPSELQMLRTAVNRANGVDTSKVGPYETALVALGLTQTILSETGEGSDKRITIALERVSVSDDNDS